MKNFIRNILYWFDDLIFKYYYLPRIIKIEQEEIEQEEYDNQFDDDGTPFGHK